MFVSALRRVRLAALSSLVGAVLAGVPASAQDGIFDEPLLSGDDGGAGDSAGSDLLSGGEAGLVDPQEQLRQQLEQAATLMEQQDWQAAVDVLTDFVGKAADPQAFVMRGTAYAELGKTELAIADLTRAATIPYAGRTPGLLETAYVQLGKLKFESNNYREAVDDLMLARQYDASNAEVNFWIGKALLRQVMTQPGQGMDQSGQANLLQAVKSLESAIDAQPDFGDAYLERGRALYRLRQIEYAVTDLEKAVELLGQSSEASADLASAYTVRASQEAQRPTPDETKIVRDLRAAIAAMDNFLQNATLGEKVPPWKTQDPLAQKPDKVLLARADGRITLANELPAEEREQLYRAAIDDVQRLLDIDASDEDLARAHYLHGVAQRLLGDLDAAIASLTDAIKVYDGFRVVYGEAYLRRGICRFHQGEYDLAVQDFQIAAENNPADPFSYEPRAMLWKGISEAQRGNYLEAIRSYTHAVSVSPRYSTAFYNRGLAYMNLGRYDQALEDFNVVLRQDPENEQAKRMRDMASSRLAG